ncbi:cell division protein FtsQ/DivIB [Alkalihalobacillus sp. AL-G]|uniref:cell division protein FtsQ/DivIB n=1 Tax=Alkalihalobacillus sp. AL-G TaxID=2926399 RepID=UPI00272D060B|nr:FtsQ-type POTRA domain-containing protein [Alkalihalobacillus sp. AL-G]WLD95068.1 FtsQ-type POTRA domain-containing protein [Alkalihalobacillus sp. AL-G]
MENKKVTTLEDRIPKLKEQRKQKANRRMIFYISFFFLLILVIIYFQSPLSHVQTIEIKGNQLVTEEQIIEKSNIKEDTNFWLVETKAVKKNVEELIQVDQVKVDRQFPSTVMIEVTEYVKVAFVEREGTYLPLLQNGETMPAISDGTVPSNAPVLIDWNKNEALQAMASELKKLQESIRIRISEIHFEPKENDSKRITLFMNDGYEVETRISGFADHMKHYPAIVQALESDEKGVIHLTESVYFNPFVKEEGKVENED